MSATRPQHPHLGSQVVAWVVITGQSLVGKENIGEPHEFHNNVSNFGMWLLYSCNV